MAKQQRGVLRRRLLHAAFYQRGPWYPKIAFVISDPYLALDWVKFMTACSALGWIN